MTTLNVAADRTRPINRTLWVAQVLLGLFMAVASGLPKLFGEATAVQLFDDIGAGDWLRYFVGVVEVAGGLGLLVGALAGPAAIGLVALMLGAAFVQVVVLDEAAYLATPLVLGVLFALIAWGRWPRTVALATTLARRR
ncbi:DoxX family protein [Cryptosporangium aurantiacum]|uniref:DoxX-like family protein n=1 Tax=Cryptosporangium aurantiacum TaxID=134849 RepID=A0A1M7RM60_9ACTN|nr:DoxX family protein [Cryptosporangium aurantiacum]SHN47344.1 DoxX-like family protein [Cryptosporangium aurantiacum]